MDRSQDRSRKRRQSLHQPANSASTAPFPMPSPPPIILPSRRWPQNSHMATPLPREQPYSTYLPPPGTQPHHTYPPQPCTTPLPTDLSRYPQNQSPRMAAPTRSRSQPPSGRTSAQAEGPPPVPRVSPRQALPPPVTTSAQMVPLRVEKQSGVTNWCTKLMNYSKMLGKKMTYSEFEADTTHGRGWVVKYFCPCLHLFHQFILTGPSGRH
ncbi:hypothetical protein DL96DRAFT_337067 [Flagelloscypha sp. PMI_526]|nr:hypothetical protein DL96DRAFT_337067 [Flagelloscypha sp. PMI_526]